MFQNCLQLNWGPTLTLGETEKTLPYFSSLSMVAILVCESHRQVGSSNVGKTILIYGYLTQWSIHHHGRFESQTFYGNARPMILGYVLYSNSFRSQTFYMHRMPLFKVRLCICVQGVPQEEFLTQKLCHSILTEIPGRPF